MLCVWCSFLGEIYFEVLNHYQTVDINLDCQQMDPVNQALIAKSYDISNIRLPSWQGQTLYFDNYLRKTRRVRVDKRSLFGLDRSHRFREKRLTWRLPGWNLCDVS